MLSALGVVATVLLAVYARGTTTGLTEDVVGAAGLLRRLLVVPVSALQGALLLVVPVVVLADLLRRQRLRRAAHGAAGGVLGVVLWLGVVVAVRSAAVDRLAEALSVVRDGAWVLAVPAWAAVLSGLLTAVGPGAPRRSVLGGWVAVWVGILLGLAAGQAPLSSSAVALLVGRCAGHLVRYTSGVTSERAQGALLVEALRHAGVPPRDLVATGETAETREYALTDQDGRHLTVTVLDGDRQTATALPRWWRALRLKGLQARPLRTVRDVAERTALVELMAHAAGARTPEVVAVGAGGDSALVVHAAAPALVPLDELPEDLVDDDLLADAWHQLSCAHRAGVTHRAVTADAVRVARGAGPPQVWLVDWRTGALRWSDLARRVDLAQLLAVLALRVGAERAVASAVRSLPDADVATLAAVLQPLALPRDTRLALRRRPQLLGELRTALMSRQPGEPLEPESLTRFNAMQVVTAVGAAVALVIVLTGLNVEEVGRALERSDWRWTAVALALGMLTYVGAALAYVALAPVRLGFARTVMVQVAGSFVAVAAPVAVGPAALNVRMLTRRAVPAALAVATVGLVQVSQVAVTVVILLVLSLEPGGDPESVLGSAPVTLAVVGVVAGAVALLLLIRPLRTALLRRVQPVVRQTWPRLVDALGRPRRLLLAVAGDTVMSLGWILAFDATLAAFGQHLSLVQVALVYFAGNAAGAVVPTPGGVGAIEVALTTGLAAAGLNPGVAASVAILFRVLTFWLQIPVGWVAMRRLVRLRAV